MLSLLAHVTPHEFSAGLAMFLAGVGTGVAVSIAVYRWLIRTR